MVAIVADVVLSFLNFHQGLVVAFLLTSQTFVSRLTTSPHLFLSRSRYSLLLGATPKDFMETLSVSLQCFLWPPWESLPSLYGQQDRVNEAFIASR